MRKEREEKKRSLLFRRSNCIQLVNIFDRLLQKKTKQKEKLINKLRTNNIYRFQTDDHPKRKEYRIKLSVMTIIIITIPTSKNNKKIKLYY